MAKPGRSFRWPWRRALLLLVIALSVVDFAGFRARVLAYEPDLNAPARADAILVLTGGSGLRIAAAMERLANGDGARLLISGVNRDVSPAEVARHAGGDPDLHQCCVDFGYEAMTTRGNAHEAAIWVREHDYGSLLVVTSDYHMPRALALLAEDMPDVKLVAVPVSTRIDPERVLSDPVSLRGMILEWAKWRVTLITAPLRKGP